MSIYYVRNDGNDLNAGTGYLDSQAFQTISKAITMIAADEDQIFVAPGFYPESVNITVNYSSCSLNGDPKCEKFLDVTPGMVWVSGSNTPDGFIDGTRETTMQTTTGTGDDFLISNFKITPGNSMSVYIRCGYLVNCEVYGKCYLRSDVNEDPKIDVVISGCKFFFSTIYIGLTKFYACYFDVVDIRPDQELRSIFYFSIINLSYMPTIYLSEINLIEYAVLFYSCLLNYTNNLVQGTPLVQDNNISAGFYFENCNIEDANPIILQAGDRNCTFQIINCKIKNCGSIYVYDDPEPYSTANHEFYMENDTIENMVVPFINADTAKPIIIGDGMAFEHVDEIINTNVVADNSWVVEGTVTYVGTPSVYPTLRDLVDTDKIGIFETNTSLLLDYTKNLLIRTSGNSPILLFWIPQMPDKQTQVSIRVYNPLPYEEPYGVKAYLGMTQDVISDVYEGEGVPEEEPEEPEEVYPDPNPQMNPSKQVFNVVNYGAVANGVTDCRNAINNAILAADDVNGIVYFPAAALPYKVSNYLYLVNNVEFWGYGATIHRDSTSSVQMMFYNNDITDIDNVTFRGLTLTSNNDRVGSDNYEGALISNIMGIVAAGISNLTIQDVTMYDMYMGLKLGASSTSKYSNNISINNLNCYNSMIPVFIEKAYNAIIKNCILDATGSATKFLHSLYIRGDTSDLHFKNCTFQNAAGGGIHFYKSSGASQTDISFEDCVVDDCMVGVYLYSGANHITFTDLEITNCGTGFKINTASNIVVDGLIMSDCANNKDEVGGFTTTALTNSQINHVYIDGATMAGDIWILSSSNSGITCVDFNTVNTSGVDFTSLSGPVSSMTHKNLNIGNNVTEGYDITGTYVPPEPPPPVNPPQEHEFVLTADYNVDWYHNLVPLIIYANVKPGTTLNTIKLGNIKVNYI